MQIAIYARFSSSLQDERSIADQLRVCRERAEREGWEVAATFADAAISGAVRARPQLDALLARAGDFDLVLAEALDRVSRDQEDIAAIYKRLAFAGCRLFTLGEGEISEIHVGLIGTMSALFLKNHAAKVRRGQRGRVAAGRAPGGITYGYRKVTAIGPDGEPERGLREVDPLQAEIVRRIYREFLAGRSPLAIARSLNAEAVPPPRSKRWTKGTINGDPVRLTGILRNPIYRGQLLYNRTRMERDPRTRRRVPRLNPKSEWSWQDVPELRIVSDEDFEAVQNRFAESGGWALRDRRRPRHVLSGLVSCGVCGAPFIVVSSGLWGCRDQRSGGACRNGRKITTAALERRAFAGLRKRLLAPELVSLFVREYHQQHAALTRDAARARSEAAPAIAVADRKIARLLDLAELGGSDVPELADRLRKARAEKAEAQRKLAEATKLPTVPLHPDIAESYRRNVETLTSAALADDVTRPEALTAIRGLIQSIEATPRPEGRGLDLKVTGQMANIIALATDHPENEEGGLSYVSGW